MPIAAPSDRRFRRAKVKPGRRRAARERVLKVARVLVLVGAVAAGGYQAVRWTRQSAVLSIGRIVVRGNNRLSTGEVLAVLSGLRGRSALWTDLEDWRVRLLNSPWV